MKKGENKMRFWDKMRVGMLCVNYTLVMALLSIIIFGATQQRTSSNVSVKYSRPYYTVTFDPAGGGGISQPKDR